MALCPEKRIGAMLIFALAVLAGCASGSSTGSPVPGPTTSLSPTTELSSAQVLKGVVQSGGTSTVRGLANANVTVYEATDGQPAVIGSAATDSSGKFEVAASQGSSDSVYYASADLGSGVVLLSVLGPALPSDITINELTTVAAAYSMAQFFNNGVIQGNSFGLRLAAGMNDNLVAVATGTSSEVLSTSPNADETNSLRSTRALANLLAASVQDPAVAGPVLFKLATPVSGVVPTDTAQALVNIAHDPARNVKEIYEQSKSVALYQPTLENMPDAWTLAVKVNDSGSDSNLIAGPGNIAFDENGYAWITNNVTQGGTTSGNFAVVLQPDGRPADGHDNTPKSPLTGGGLLGGGYGVDIDQNGAIWFGNFGWGGDNPSPTGNGSLSQFSAQGKPISGPNGYQGGVVRAQGIAVDANNNIWIASFGNNQLVVLPNGDLDHPITYQLSASSQPFDVALAGDGTAWMSNSASSDDGSGASIAKYQLADGALKQLFETPVGNSLKGIAVDSLDNVWLASGGDSKVYAFSPDGESLGTFDGGGVTGPWGVAVDGDDHIWVANFSLIEAGSDYTNAGISKLAGANPATIPPGLKTGDPISPPTGYTLPSAGSQVLLHDGTPLYGPGQPPSFSPFMRQTIDVIDQAGNIWACNNWKPNFDIDHSTNPGGDGIVIFVGLAKPPVEQH